jgi:SAM-dependent methyltransferase
MTLRAFGAHRNTGGQRMTKYMDEGDPAVTYYDSDYPSEHFGKYRENFDEIVKFQGIALDVPRYRELAKGVQGPVLELCCGSGRIAIPLARDRHAVVAVDASKAMLGQLQDNLRQEDPAVTERVKYVEADVSTLSLGQRFNLIICGFNSLLLVGDQEAQLRVLSVAREHLTDDGILVLDVVNPLALKLEGDPAPKPFFTRRNPLNGNAYTRFAMVSPLGPDQRQRLHGYYDEVEPDGRLRRQFYSFHWRPIFRSELELMLRLNNLATVKMEAGHSGEPLSSAVVPRFFVRARRA